MFYVACILSGVRGLLEAVDVSHVGAGLMLTGCIQFQ